MSHRYAHGRWSTVAQLAAGAGAGFYVLPEVEDEVLVGFVEGEPVVTRSLLDEAPLDGETACW